MFLIPWLKVMGVQILLTTYGFFFDEEFQEVENGLSEFQYPQHKMAALLIWMFCSRFHRKWQP